MPPRQPLPIDEVLPEIVAALATHSSLVLRAATGAGKTTRVPLALLEHGLSNDRKIVVLEPRRVAARAAAARMAAELGDGLGNTVGYRVRFDRCIGPRTRIEVVTDGVFLQQLQRDPFLDDVGIVIFDELHERSVDAELAIALVRKVMREARDDLRVVAMSATLDA
ncbi:MAG: DEAD/DEAH box helicase, partial [Planctomycetes bacterium]|nr:DEAD/DEAH box helicase [Planctomycetota bacterium]